MSSTTNKSDTMKSGKAYYPKANAKAGVVRPHLYFHDFGAVETLDADGICVDVTATGSATLTATGALVSGGVATFTTPRGVSVTSTANESGVTFTFTGTDVYGETVTEAVTGPNATTANGKKAFKTVTSVAVSGALTSAAVDVGTSKILGLPIRLANKSDFIAFTKDGLDESASSTLVAGLASDGTSTSTTADVRGTISPNTAPNGTLRFACLLNIPDDSTKEKVYGAAQA